MISTAQSGRAIAWCTRSGHGWQLSGQFDRVFTANPGAARQFGVSHRPLSAAALELVQRQELALSPELKSRRLLRQACSEFGLTDPAGASEQHLPIIRELLHANLPAGDLHGLGRRGSHIAGLLERYRELLAEEQLIDPGQLYWLAAEAVSERQRIAVVGHTLLGRGELHFIDALAAEGSLLLLPDSDVLPGESGKAYAANRELTEMTMRRSNWLSTPAGTTGKADRPAISAAGHADVWTEVKAVLARAKELISSGESPDSILLLTMAESEYGPVLQTVAWEYGMHVSSYNPVLLAHTRIGELLQLILQAVVADLPFEETVRLTRHAFGPRLRHEQWRRARRSGASGKDAWGECGLDTALLNWPAAANPGSYAALVQACFDTWGTPARASRSAHEALALQTLQESLQELTTLYPAGFEIGLPEWLQDVQEVLNLATVHAAPGRGGLQLHTPLSVSGAGYRHVFVLGAVEGQLPRRLRDDPVLPWHYRQQLEGLDGITRTVNRELATIRSAMAGATESLHFTVPRRYQGGETTPSTLLGEFGVTPQPGGQEILASIEEERRQQIVLGPGEEDETMASARHSLSVELRRQTGDPFDEYDGITGLPVDPDARTFSVSQLSQLGQCPYRWFASYVLGLAADEEHLFETDALTIGSLYHNVLDRALRTLLDSRDPEPQASLAAELPAAFAAVERSLGQEQLDLRELPGWHIARREHLARLQKAVASTEFWAGEPVSSEQSFDCDWRGLRMRGRIDRIDRSEDGLTLIDIKTGSYVGKVQDAEGNLKVDLQLPVYSEVAGTLYPEDDILGTRYFSIRQAEEVPSRLPDPGFLEQFVLNSRSLLERGAFPVQPDRAQKACEYCDYRTVCRVGRRQEHKLRWQEQP